MSADIVRNKNEELFLKMTLRNAKDHGKSYVLTFADRHSVKRKWVSTHAGIGVVRRTVTSRPDAERSLTAIKETLERAKALSRPSM